MTRVACMGFVLAASVAAAQERPKMNPDEQAILALEKQFLAAWERGDAAGAVAHIADDAVRVGALGDVQHGRAAIEAGYQKLFNGPMRGARAEWQPIVKLLSADVALAEGPLTIVPPDGSAPKRGWALDVWQRRAGRWWLVEAHPKFFPPAPR